MKGEGKVAFVGPDVAGSNPENRSIFSERFKLFGDLRNFSALFGNRKCRHHCTDVTQSRCRREIQTLIASSPASDVKPPSSMSESPQWMQGGPRGFPTSVNHPIVVSDDVTAVPPVAVSAAAAPRCIRRCPRTEDGGSEGALDALSTGCESQ
ncbi:hypothetical protein EVAR_51209_1 [Eumeta japonica]|uniref:Uncharacterized protein n=1 Tax=Eumeta variegata TaxID=151549 RepID=A0A4C1ZBI8_EUMVA|nr:hypothetical protein EVAR_51209_1 [Eumeta japonica]